MMTNLKMNIRKLSAVFLTMVVIVTALIVSGCGQTVIDIKEARLLKIKLEGFDGKGKAVISVNEGKLKELKKEYRNKKSYDDIEDILDSIVFEMQDPRANGNLSNGDKFNVVAKYDKELAEEIGIELLNTTLECSVDDKLKEGTIIDAFKGVKLEYFGDSGEATARVNADDCDDIVNEQKIYFEIEGENDYLENGNRIVVRAESYNDLEEDGYFLKEKTKTFTVESLTGARTTLEGVNFKDIANDMQDEFEEYIEDDFSVSGLNYKYKSGKNRDLNTFEFKYKPKYELLRYAYAYNEDDISSNALVAYYKVTTSFECVDNQIGYEKDNDLMKKGDKDTGVTYIVIATNSFMVKADNTIDEEYLYLDSVNALTEDECNHLLAIDNYKFEYYGKDFKKLDITATEPATEEATDKATETTATESATENATD